MLIVFVVCLFAICKALSCFPLFWTWFLRLKVQMWKIVQTFLYYTSASAPPLNYARPTHGELYAGAYGEQRNAYEMRRPKVWQCAADARISPPPEYPGGPLELPSAAYLQQQDLTIQPTAPVQCGVASVPPLPLAMSAHAPVSVQRQRVFHTTTATTNSAAN